MSDKTNGSKHNGSGDSEKLVPFPAPAERERIRREKEKHKQKDQKSEKSEHRKPVPFLNLSKIPPFTRFMVAAFLLIHVVLHLFLSPSTLYQVFITFGFTPAYFTGALQPFPLMALLSPFTHLFIHGNWVHLFFNTTMGLVFGMFFEKKFGTRAVAFFFFVCGLFGALLYLALSPFSEVPVIGASGGISGLFGAMTIVLFQQRQKVPGLAGRRLAKYGPWPLILFWVFFMAGMGSLNGDALAWQAHVGGFLGGIALLYMMQKGKLKFLSL